MNKLLKDWLVITDSDDSFSSFCKLKARIILQKLNFDDISILDLLFFLAFVSFIFLIGFGFGFNLGLENYHNIVEAHKKLLK